MSDNHGLEVVNDLLHDAIYVMEEFPVDYVPPESALPVKSSAGIGKESSSVQDILSQPDVQSWYEKLASDWPSEFIPIFIQSSSVIAQILDGFGVNQDPVRLEMAAFANPRVFDLLMTLAQMEKEAKASDSGEDKDPLAMKAVLYKEIQRLQVSHGAPFVSTLTTLLGDDALLWLTAASRDGFGKLQPFEFSRTGWSNLWNIDNQIEIEKELLRIHPGSQDYAKMVVALSWTLVAMASFIPAAVFAGETIPHLSSWRESTSDQQFTISVGVSNHTLLSFHTTAMLRMIRVIAKGMKNPLISAADLMWIGAALAEVREVRAGHGPATEVSYERFDLFLSHRGRDAKQVLAQAVQSRPESTRIFLDCLTLPRGIINRSFIYGSLARSDRVLIVETDNFQESEWCRKEAWFADAMASCGVVSAERVTLAKASVEVAQSLPAQVNQSSREELEYEIASRVLSDIDYWARAPNRHSLTQLGHSTKSLERLDRVVKHVPEDESSKRTLAGAIAETLTNVVAESPDAQPVDLWAAALQLVVAAFAGNSKTRSKMEVRRGIDRLNNALNAFVAAKLHQDPVFIRNAQAYLALLPAALVLRLANFNIDQRIVPVVQATITGAAQFARGLLLLDVRTPGKVRDFRLRLAAVLVQDNLGSIGIVQDAADQVHQDTVDGLPLEILPCVTMYPDMKNPFGNRIESA
ncbi:MAG TPA: toll/interleukin-1 receptor domain-containing protein [Pyrinomonadaceae bacterium]|nr:toll/interleukin-1 receptor domain-containing protein [Pyrinomonadaceae bacterium]